MTKIKGLKLLFISFVGIFSLNSSYAFSQVSVGGVPPSFNYQQTLRSITAETKVPVDFYVEDLLEVDNWRAREGLPMPVAKLVTVDYTMSNSGYNTILPGGENIWRLHLTAKDAVAIMLYYNEFYIPEGGKLFIYSADRSQLLGAYTHNTNPRGGLFATEFVGGDALVLEYVASEISDEKPRICISEIGYGYNTAALRAFCDITTRASSGSCMVDINCEEGDAWHNEKNGVCHTIQRIGRSSFICSGVLMNNTAEDFKPLILTARHCALGNSGAVASASDMEQWLFYFHKEREGCGSDYLAVVPKTMTGCKLLVNTGTEGGSDGMLLLLNDMIPENYDVFYNGWDRRDIAASSGVSIHHPSGDNMKISTYNSPAKVYTFYSSEFNGGRNAHLNVTFAKTSNGHGVTEGGSSGSPLYNENKHVVATLTGGNSSCSYSEGLNIYGKLSYHWDKYKTDSSSRMDVWLDPLNLKVETLQGRFRNALRPSPVSLKAANLGNRASLSWGAPMGGEVPVRYNVYRNNGKIGETVSPLFVDYEPVDGANTYSVSALYASGEESPFISTTLFFIKHKAPSELKAERISDTYDVMLSWKLPVYEQTIYWGTMDATYIIGSDDRVPFYFGQKWSQEEINSLNQNIIKAIRFFPIKDNKYEVYISQGARVYRQKIESSSLIYTDINTIALDNPFVIDGSKSLIVAVYASYIEGEYPAVCDNGPVVNGKGNVYSNDGENWGNLHDENTPDKFNYNFVVSAVVSSERGTITNSSEVTEAGILKYNFKMTSKSENVLPRIAELRMESNISLRSSIPAPFPELTKSRIYRNGSVHRDVSASNSTYIDKTSNSYPYVYSVSAIYGDMESEKSDMVNITTVDMEVIDASVNIFPTTFSDNTYLRGHEFVSRIEVLSISGKTCLVVNSPGETIDTSSLMPGIYFFRVYSNNNLQKVIKAIKTN